jgi:hypothetical protein
MLARFDQQVNTHVDVQPINLFDAGIRTKWNRKWAHIADYYKYANESNCKQRIILKSSLYLRRLELAPYVTKVKLVQSDSFTF